MNDIIVLGIVVALITAILGPWITEYYKWHNEPKRTILHESEVRYYGMLKNVSGFFSSRDPDKLEEFYEHYSTAWLYAPDQVIRSINELYKKYIPIQEKDEKEVAMGTMIWEMRRAFYGNTDLEPKDFLFISVER
jgi:hypothetical protein